MRAVEPASGPSLGGIEWRALPPLRWVRGERRGALWFAHDHPPHIVELGAPVCIADRPLDETAWAALAGGEPPLFDEHGPRIPALSAALGAWNERHDGPGHLGLLTRALVDGIDQREREELGAPTTLPEAVIVTDALAAGWWGQPTDGRAHAWPHTSTTQQQLSHTIFPLLMTRQGLTRTVRVHTTSEPLPHDGCWLAWWPAGLPDPGRSLPPRPPPPLIARKDAIVLAFALLASFVIPILRGQTDYISRGWPNLLFGGLFAGALLALALRLAWQRTLPIWAPTPAGQMAPLDATRTPEQALGAQSSDIEA